MRETRHPTNEAIHESGHAVVARVLGQPVKLASLAKVTTRHLCGHSEVDRHLTIIALAGLVAEDRHAGYTPDERAMMWETVWRTALANAMRHLDASGGGMMGPAKRAAERLVHEHWGAIKRVAKRLSACGELSGDELDALSRVLKALSCRPSPPTVPSGVNRTTARHRSTHSRFPSRVLIGFFDAVNIVRHPLKDIDRRSRVVRYFNQRQRAPGQESNQEPDDGKNASPCLTQKAPYKGRSAESEEKREPVSDIDTGGGG
jgi:hypothetical protein